MKHLLVSIFGASWRTSLLGLTAAIWISVQPIIETHAIDYKKLGYAAFVATMGFLMKDKNVTGGTTAATDEAAKRIG